MPIFYFFHNIIPSADKSGITWGQRNAKLFLIGMFFYVLIYVTMKNMQLKGLIDDKMYDPLFVGLLILFFVDIFVMACLYKDYFGRSITNEVGEIVGDKKWDDKYNWDNKNHTYKRKKIKQESEKSESKSEKSELKSKSKKSELKSVRQEWPGTEEVQKSSQQEKTNIEKEPKPKSIKQE